MRRLQTKQFWLVITLLCGWVFVSPAQAYVLPFNGYPKLEINGTYTLTYSSSTITGNTALYDDDNFGFTSPFTDTASLYVKGALWKDLYLNANVTQSPNTPNTTSWNVRYDGSNAKVLVGEFTANMTGNSFVSLNRSLDGVQVDAVLPKGHLSIVAAELPSQVHTDTLYGRNVSGPYFLTATPVVDGSEIVSIDNVQQARQKDYTLNYATGELDFVPSILVGTTQSIVISYEVQSTGLNGGGTIYAVSGGYPILKKLTAGLIMIGIKGPAVGPSQAQKTEQFVGNGQPGPYTLTYRPIVPGTVTVAINGVPPPAGAYTPLAPDFYSTGALIFNSGFEPPVGSTITVTYSISVPGSAATDQITTGVNLDWRPFPFLGFSVEGANSGSNNGEVVPAATITDGPFISVAGQTLTLSHYPIQPGTDSVVTSTQSTLNNPTDYTINYTTGKLTLNSTSAVKMASTIYVTYQTEQQTVHLNGNNAVALKANFGEKKLTGMVGYRNVDAGFNPLGMVGYQNINQELEWSANYTPNSLLSLSTHWDNSHQPYDPTAANTSDLPTMSTQHQSYSLDFHLLNWPSLSLRHDQQSSSEVEGGQVGSSSSMDSISLAKTNKIYTASVSVNRMQTDSRQFSSSATDPDAAYTPQSTDTVSHYNGTTTAETAKIAYHGFSKLELGANFAANQTTAQADTVNSNTTAHSYEGDATYKASTAWTFKGSVQQSTTGATTSATGSEVPAVTTNSYKLGADWRVRSNLSIGTDLTIDRNLGGDSGDSASSTISNNLDWDATKLLKFTGNFAYQKIDYLDQSGDSSTNYMLGLGSDIGPLGKFRIKLNANQVWGNDVTGVNGSSATSLATMAQAIRTADTPTDATSGSTITGNNSLHLDATIIYPIAARQDLSLTGLTEHGTGYPGDTQKNSVKLGWNFHFEKHITFTLSVTDTTMRTAGADSTTTGQNYHAVTVNGQFNCNF